MKWTLNECLGAVIAENARYSKQNFSISKKEPSSNQTTHPLPDLSSNLRSIRIVRRLPGGKQGRIHHLEHRVLTVMPVGDSQVPCGLPLFKFGWADAIAGEVALMDAGEPNQPNQAIQPENRN